jgi:MBG domain-containing protein/HYDIN/CFA65/VesB family protein/centrosomal CEP192-like protein
MSSLMRRLTPISFCLLFMALVPLLPAHAQGTSVTPTTISFGNQLVGTTSAPQMVTVKNTGITAVTVTSVTIVSVTPPPPATAPFTALTNCAKIAAGKSCTFNVKFAPTAMGQVTAKLTINFASPVAAQTVSLGGTGIAPVATPSTTSLSFGNQQEGTTSGPQSMTLSNTGTAPLQINNITIGGANPGNFAETNTCGNTTGAKFPATLAVGAPPCTITVTFAPNATGTRAANLSISVAKPATSQTVSLSGTGVAPSATILPNPLAFGSETDGTTTSMPVTLSNTGSGPLTVTSIGISGSSTFTQTNTCSPTPATVTTSCTINVSFKPTTVGAKSATLSVSIRYLSMPLTVSLTGTGTTGTGTPPTFTSSSSTIFTVGVAGSFTPTASGSPTPTIAESGTLPSGVTFSGGVLSGTPTQAGTFSITFKATNSAGSATQPFTLTVNKGTATVTLSNMTQTYNGSALKPTVTTSPANVATTLTGAPDTNAGTYNVTATITDPNYTGSPANGSFVINKAAATVSLSNLTATYTGSPLSPTVTTSPANVATTLTGAPDTNAGTYNVMATITDPNYTGSPANGSFVINPAAATVTAAAASKTYGATDPALTATETGFTAADAPTITLSATRAAGESVGTYAITPAAAGAAVANYSITYTAANFTISKALASVTPNAASKTYGAADPALSGTLAGFVGSDNITATYSRTAGETVGGSPYTISATLSPAAALGNYTITYNMANFTITQAAAMVMATAASKTYGSADPTLSAT